jgi:chromosome segregation ATPase
MRITALYCTNFKRLHDIELRPDADRTLILIGGRNANGKSSLLDALSAAFGGKKQQPDDPVRHGAAEATIRIELDGGELEVRRVIQPDGESLLEVRDRFGAVKSPQKTLDELVGARFLDPLQFLQLTAKEQLATLMRVIPEAKRIGALNENRERAFTRRTEIGRDLTKAEGELARLPEVMVDRAIDVAQLNEEVRTIAEQQRAGDGLGAAVGKIETLLQVVLVDIGNAKQRVEKLERELDQERNALLEMGREAAAREAELAGAKERLAASARKWKEMLPRREQLAADLARADAHNRAVFAAEAQQRRRGQVTADVEQLTKERGRLTGVIDAIDVRKAEILAAAALPIAGLTITEDGIELAGVPLDQASDAEQWRVALALAIAASPGLDDVWIRDGALLDDESLALVAEQAHAAGKRPWIERVGTRDPGVIEIRDGRVAHIAKTEAA